jgi:branched-subunit amino acid permease
MKKNNAKSSIYIILLTAVILVVLTVVAYENYEGNIEKTIYEGMDPVEITEKFLKQKEQVNSV